MIALGLKLLKHLAAFLRHPVGQLAAICLVFGGLGWWHGEQRFGDGQAVVQDRWDKAVADAKVAARAKEAKDRDAAQRVGKQVSTAQADIRSTTQTLIREVPVYVTAEDDRRCAVGPGLVQLHDAAAGARLPGPPNAAAGADGQAAGPALSDVAAVVTENYGACNAAIEQLKGWQAWAHEVGLVR